MSLSNIDETTLQNLPQDPHMLASFVNLKLRDEYSEGLDEMCDDMNIDRGALVRKLAAAGYEYLPEANSFR